jgi:Peptidase family S41
MKNSLIILLIFSLFGKINMKSQTLKDEKKYSAVELNQDIDSLKKFIIQIHPDPFTVIQQKSFDKKIAEIKTQCRTPKTLKAYYRLITPLVASISDGHTAIRFPGINKLLNDSSQLFPYIGNLSLDAPNIVIEDYVYDTIGPIPIGAEIISINKIPSKIIIEKIIENTSGESKAYRLKVASNIFLGLLLNTFFDFSDNFTVEYVFKNKLFKKSFPAINYSTFKAAIQTKKKLEKNNDKPIADYSLSLQKEQTTAIIDFRYFDDEEKFKLFLDSTFTLIKKEQVKNLIIDLRANGGGNSQLGNQLLKYISPVAFTQFSKTIVKYSQKQKDFFKEVCGEDSSYCSTYAFLLKQKNGEKEVLKTDSLIAINAPSNHFSGKLYLLTSIRTFSSASSFAQCFKHYKMGTIIGEETGGWIVSYGDKIKMTLPITQLSLSVSQKKFYTVGSTDSSTHGAIPDIKIAAGKAMERALADINK